MSELLQHQESSPNSNPSQASLPASAKDPNEETIYSYFEFSQPQKKNESLIIKSPYTKLENQYKLKLSQHQSLVSQKNKEIRLLKSKLNQSKTSTRVHQDTDSDENQNLMNIINSVKDS